MLPSGIAVYKNRRGASLRLSLPCMSNAIKLSRRTFLAPHRGSCPKGLCKRTGFLGVKRRENPVRRHFERSEMREGYVAVLHEGVGISIASDYSTIPMTIHAALFLPPSFGRRCPEGAEVGRVNRYSHIQGSQPRLASLVCPFQRKGRE